MNRKKIIIYIVGIILCSSISTMLLSLFEFKGRQPLSAHEVPVVFIISAIAFTIGAIVYCLTRDY